MKRRFLSLLLTLSVMFAAIPTASAAYLHHSDLESLDTLTLTEDTALSPLLWIEDDLVIDLNGYTLTTTSYKTTTDCLSIRPNATVTIRNGTIDIAILENYGTIECLEDVTFTGTTILNQGHIKAIRRCEMHSVNLETALYPNQPNPCIANMGGTIDRIEGVDIHGGGIYNSGENVTILVENVFGMLNYETEYRDGRIDTIRNCRIDCSMGENFRFENPALSDGYMRSSIGSIENCIFIFGTTSKTGPTNYGLALRQGSSIGAFRDCTFVNLAPVPMAIVYDGSGGEDTLFERCIIIGDASPVCDFTEDGTGDDAREVRFSNLIQCKTLPYTGTDLDAYTAWTMPARPPVPSLDHFAPVNEYAEGQFADVAGDYWGAPNIAKAYELGLMKGSSDTAFDPEGSVTVAQAITMAARLHSIYSTGTESFVQSDVWYQVYVDYCKENGILTRDFDDYNAPATRRDFAAILAAALPAEALPAINTVSAIPDVAEDSEFADAIYALYRAGILTGNDAAGTFGPDTSISRAAAAAILTRMADPTLRRSITL